MLLAWTLLSHALDLVAKLPGINGLNRTLGAALGFLKGPVVLYLASWVLCTLTGFIPPETAEKTRLMALLIFAVNSFLVRPRMGPPRGA